ncbi:MAG: hypothetical protein SWO11_21540 [Thermodesulfobacteriota bacterium]|nr:hypothetical protein [Thermodesulfobacteriota bacterium]
MKPTNKIRLLVLLLCILFLASLAYGTAFQDIPEWSGVKKWSNMKRFSNAPLFTKISTDWVFSDLELWENGTTPYFVQKDDLNLDDVYADPGVSLVDAGKTNFQGGIHSWTPSGTNRVYAVLDSGVSVLAIEFVDNDDGASNVFRDIGDLKSDLTAGSPYIFTAIQKINTGSAYFQWRGGLGTLEPGREIIETEWTGVTFYFIAETDALDRMYQEDLSAGETLFIKEYDIRELTFFSVLGDEIGELEILVNGGFEEKGSGNPWIPGGWTNYGLDVDESASTTVCVSGVSAIHINATSYEGITQNITASCGLHRLTAQLERISGPVRFVLESVPSGTYPLLVIYSSGYATFEQVNEFFYMPVGTTGIVIYVQAYNAAAQFILDDLSIQKINTAWTPYDGNTLALSSVDSGISITYVDNGSGASIFLTDIGDLAIAPTNGKPQRYTCTARINTGDCEIHIKNSAGTSKASASISDTGGESISLNFNSGLSDYITFVGLGAGEEVWLTDFSVKE